MDNQSLVQATQAHRIQSILRGRQVPEAAIRDYIESYQDYGDGSDYATYTPLEIYEDYLRFKELGGFEG